MAEDKERAARVGTPAREYGSHPRRPVAARDRERTALELWRRLLDPPVPWYGRLVAWVTAISRRARATSSAPAIEAAPVPHEIDAIEAPEAITVQQLLDARRLQKMPAGRRPH